MKIVYVAFAALTLSAPALAADFSGPRIEADIGWDRPQAKIDLTNLSAHGHDSGVVYGGEAGYDLRLGHLVVGALAGIDGTSAKNCTVNAQFNGCLKEGRDWGVGGRIGAVIAPKTLLYGKAEYVNVRLSDAFNSAANTVSSFSTRDNRGGYRLGAGVEFALTSMIYLKGEYRYSDYRHDAIYQAAGPGQAGLSRNQLVGGVGLRF